MPQQLNIVEIGHNDDLFETIRKCNYNFKQYSNSQSSAYISLEDVSSDVDDVKARLAEQIEKLLTLIDEKTEAQNEKIEDVRKKLEENMIPDIGTYMFATYNPNTKWPSTKWEQVADGTFLMAAGTSHTSGNKYGSNTHTLTANEMPSHNHGITQMVGWSGSSGSGLAASDGQVQGSNVTQYTGGGQPHNNIPQSIAIPLWHRTE